jgi:hypothetical protein
MLRVIEIPFDEKSTNEYYANSKSKNASLIHHYPTIYDEDETIIEIKNNEDYQVISLDLKPSPGRLDDFIPEIERQTGYDVLIIRIKKL